MKEYQCFALTVLVTAFLVSCTAGSYIVRPTGDFVTILTNQETECTGELLTVDDSTIYFSMDVKPLTGKRVAKKEIVSARTEDVRLLEIAGYANRKWVTSVILFEAVPTVLLAIAAAAEDVSPGGVLAVFSVPTVLTYLAFEASTPSPPRFEYPLTTETIEELKKYARFPQGLKQTQLEQLLQQHEQKEIRQLK